MERMIAVCGLDCAACEARIAAQADDQASKERIAAKWRKDYNAPNIDAAYVTCDGCLASDGRLGGWCLECELRACGVARGLPNCAHCADFDSCAKLASFFNAAYVFAPQLRTTLEEIRGSLQT